MSRAHLFTLVRRANAVLAESGQKWCSHCGPAEENITELETIIADGGDRYGLKAVKPEGDFTIEKRRPDGSIQRRSAWCRPCKRRTQKKYVRALKRRDPKAYKAQNQRRWETVKANPDRHERAKARARTYMAARYERAKTDPEVAEALQSAHHRWLAGMRDDPVRYAAHLENRRIESRLRRASRGVTARPRPADTNVPVVPAEPFIRWIEELWRLLGVSDAETREDDRPLPRDLAARMETSVRHLYDLRHRRKKYVAVDTVDRALLSIHEAITVDGRLITTLDDLYPGHRLDVPISRAPLIEDWLSPEALAA